MIFFHSYRNPGLIIDIVRDIRSLNALAMKAKKAGMIILGGGVCKHQVANAMLMVSNPRSVGPVLVGMADRTTFEPQRNGADYSVYIVRCSCWGLNISVDFFDVAFTDSRTLDKNLMGRTLGRARTKPYPGVKSGWEQRVSRLVLKKALQKPERRTELSPPRHQVYADATLVFPLLVAATFARDREGQKAEP